MVPGVFGFGWNGRRRNMIFFPFPEDNTFFLFAGYLLFWPFEVQPIQNGTLSPCFLETWGGYRSFAGKVGPCCLCFMFKSNHGPPRAPTRRLSRSRYTPLLCNFSDHGTALCPCPQSSSNRPGSTFTLRCQYRRGVRTTDFSSVSPSCLRRIKRQRRI